jgi:hypothetical protein
MLPSREQIELYVALRRSIRPVLPGFLLAVASFVLAHSPSDAAPRSFVGELDRARLIAAYPELGLDASVDWVAFGFPGMDDYDAHVGVLVDTDTWPLQCEVGVHVANDLWIDVRERFAGFGARSSTTYSYASGVREHRFVRPSFGLRLDQVGLDDDVRRAGTAAIELWTAGQAILERVSA